MFRSPLPESKAAIDSPNSWAAKASADTVENGIPRFCCPSCSKHLQHKSAGEKFMKLMYSIARIIRTKIRGKFVLIPAIKRPF